MTTAVTIIALWCQIFRINAVGGALQNKKVCESDLMVCYTPNMYEHNFYKCIAKRLEKFNNKQTKGRL